MPVFPVVLSVPHAGQDYPEALLADAAVPAERLRLLEDRHADKLIMALLERDATAIVAHRARAWLDLNRDPRELDSGMIAGLPSTQNLITTRSKGGLGLIPRRLGNSGELWRRKFSASEISQRIAGHHQPYHAAISAALSNAHQRFGIAILLDCHSMPPIRATGGGTSPIIVIGDRFGQSAGSTFTDCVEAVARRHGLGLARNAPYAGGYSLDRHGRPPRGVHAIQVEIDRSLYLDESAQSPGKGLAAMQFFLGDVFDALVNEALAAGTAIAAE